MIEKKRIAINTLMLYFRMVLIMGVALYTSRIVLKVLGAADYGLYNVVGGVVSMFSFLNGSLSSGTSRFITYDIGIGNEERLRETFNVAFMSHLILAFIILLLTETIGLWFVNNKLVFDESRRFAVNIVYQFSVLTLMLQLTQVPFAADIIAHEKMNVYAYVSIVEVLLRLAMIFLLQLNSSIDNLIFYSSILFFVQFIILGIYRLYCRKYFSESRFQFCKDKTRYKEIFSFSGWDVIGSLSVLSQGQGINILLNMFFGSVVNAARAITYQLEGAVSQLTNNFMTAVNPQIVKSFAAKKYDEMIDLIEDASKFGFFLLSVFLIPILFKLDYILQLWLKDVPEQTEIFAKIILTMLMIRIIARPVIHGIHATGHIKRLNLIAGLVGLLPLPVTYILFKLDFPAVWAFLTLFIWGVTANILETIIFKMEMKTFKLVKYFMEVYFRCFVVGLVCFALDYLLAKYIVGNFFIFLLFYGLSVLMNAVIVFCLGFDKNKQKKIIGFIRCKFHAKTNAQ